MPAARPSARFTAGRCAAAERCSGVSRELELRPASAWRSRYALADGDRELAIFDGKGWGKRPVAVIIDDLSAVDPGLVLFAAFVVRGLAEDASSAAGRRVGGDEQRHR